LIKQLKKNKLKQFVAILFMSFFIALTSSMNAYAQKSSSTEKNISGTKDLPLELNLLIDSLQKDSPEIYNKILPGIMNIDRYARPLSKEDIFLVGKVEIYKTLLKNYDSAIKQPVDGTSLKTIRDALAKTQDNFLRWFLQALLQDTQSLISNPIYKELILQKNNNLRTEKLEYRRLDKKASLLQYWIQKISPEAEDYPAGLKSELAPRMLEALNNIEKSFLLLSSQGTMLAPGEAIKEASAMKFFTVKEIKARAAQAAIPRPEKSVEDILAPLDPSPTSPASAAAAQDLPKPVQENWLEDKNAPSGLKNLPIPSNDADWLQDF
jgi:hypothetical protein